MEKMVKRAIERQTFNELDKGSSVLASTALALAGQLPAHHDIVGAIRHFMASTMLLGAAVEVVGRSPETEDLVQLRRIFADGLEQLDARIAARQAKADEAN